MILKQTGYSYDDLTIIPKTVTDIKSRSECNPFTLNGELPIFTAPMSTIVSLQNFKLWKNNRVIPIIPRNVESEHRKELLNQGEWVAVSLKEFELWFITESLDENKTYRVCIDLANGHMKRIYELIKEAKQLSYRNNYNIVIMTGNIANPETYQWLLDNNVEVDYIRVSIGTGANCITSSNTGIHYPVATLLDEINKIKKPGIKVIADGGIRNYDDVVKALALGADYVMIGSVFTAALESAGEMIMEAYNSHYNFTCKDGIINNGVSDILDIYDEDEQVKRNFVREMKSIIKESYGMSTKKAQRMINPNGKLKTSEGCTKYIPVKYTLNQWIENMIDLLKSAMSYTNSRTLLDFIGKQTLIPNSIGTVQSVNK